MLNSMMINDRGHIPFSLLRHSVSVLGNVRIDVRLYLHIGFRQDITKAKRICFFLLAQQTDGAFYRKLILERSCRDHSVGLNHLLMREEPPVSRVSQCTT